MIDEKYIKDLLILKGKTLYHREGQELEFKEQFNLAGLAEYFRDFAALANNRGGHIIFGVKDSPRIPTGLNSSALDQFNKTDPQRISGFLLDLFSTDIEWEMATVEMDGKCFGVFRVNEGRIKPVIARKDEGKGQIIKNGEVYYRYGGRTQKIQFAELENIINKRIERNNREWLDLMSKIGKAGPENAAILDTEKALIEKGESRILVLDEDLAAKLKFIKEGEFVEKKGRPTLKLVGDVVPVEKVEVVKKVKEGLIKAYPLSGRELAEEVKNIIPDASTNRVWEIIRDNDLKSNTVYSAYNFRTKKHEDEFLKTGKISSGTPSIYNEKAVDFIVNILKQSP